MDKHQSSLTAEGIAFIRAWESLKPAGERVCDDPLARHFVGPLRKLGLPGQGPGYTLRAHPVRNRFGGLAGGVGSGRSSTPGCHPGRSKSLHLAHGCATSGAAHDIRWARPELKVTGLMGGVSPDAPG